MKSDSHFVNVCKRYILDNNLYNKNHNSLYSLSDIMSAIEYILYTGASWRSLNLPAFNGRYKWQSIYHHFYKFSQANIFQNVYFELLDNYFKNNASTKLKYLSIDTSFIKNEYASDVAFNGYCKKKRLSKISIIVDSNGVPISLTVKPGNISDQSLFFDNINSSFVDIKYQSNNNKHIRYMLADSIYDTHDIRDKIKDLNIVPIISFNKRNTKDKSIIQNKQFNNFQKKIYNKRIKIENTFSWIYKNRRTSRRYDKMVNNYCSFLYMAFIRIIIKRS